MRTSLNANVASGLQTAMSAAAIRPRPPARAGPPTRATHRLAATPRSPRARRRAGRSASAPVAAAAAVSLRSAPEQKTGPVWRQHDHPYGGVGLGRGERRPAAARSAPMDSALRLVGLSSVSVATPARTSERIRFGHAGRLDGVASQLPDGEPVPATGELPEPARAERRRARLRRLRARAVLRVPVRLLRLQHVRAGRGGEPGRLRRRGARRDRAGRPGARRRRRRASTRSSSAAVRRRCCRPPTWPGSWSAIDKTWGLAAGAEITTEANPESVDPASLRALRAAGFTRISLGMQSAAPARTARSLIVSTPPGRAPQAAAEAREAGFEHVNLDLIYGTPGETADDFAASLDAVIGAGVDHVSAYALIVEDGTRMAARMRRGELPYPSDDVAADRYLAAEAGPRRGRLRLVRGVQLGPSAEAPVPAQPALLDRRRLVGLRPGRAQPRRRGALVERASTRRRTRSGWPRACRRATAGRS